jgi:aminocarboxymuconate-semialdehyde decarboxylase
VPLQDIDLAIRELEYVVKTLGFAGVEVGSNINGVPIGAAAFDPFFEACEALGAAVFVHAIRPAGMERLVGPPPLQQVLGYPGDVGLAAASVITSNLLVRRPGCASPSAMAAARWRRCCPGCSRAGACSRR